jgi:integrase
LNSHGKKRAELKDLLGLDLRCHADFIVRLAYSCGDVDLEEACEEWETVIEDRREQIEEIDAELKQLRISGRGAPLSHVSTVLHRANRCIGTARQIRAVLSDGATGITNTVMGYMRDLTGLHDYCEREGLEDWPAVDARHVRDFCAGASAAGLAPASVQRLLSTLRSFFQFLMGEGVLSNNPARLFQGPKGMRKLPKTLDPNQMQRLIEIPDDDVFGIRDRAMMELLYSSALRLIELVRLNRNDLDLRDRTVRMLGKGNVTRVIPVGSFALQALRRWHGARAERVNDIETPVVTRLESNRV